MTIQQLNKTEKRIINQFQVAWIRNVKSSIKKGGLNDSSQGLIKKKADIIAKAMVESGLKLGIKWLISKKPTK